MRVCLVSGTCPPVRCGVGDYAWLLARHLARAGCEVTLLTSRGACAPPPPGVRVLPVVRNWGLAGLPELAARIETLRPQVVHVQYPTAAYPRALGITGLIPWLKLRRPGIACVVTLHEYAAFTWRGRLRLSLALASARRIICTNHRDRRALVRRHCAWRARVRVIPLGSNIGPFSSRAGKRVRGGKKPGTIWLTHFGTVMPNKGWESLLLALQALVAGGRDLGLRVVGALEPGRFAYHRRVADRITALGLQTRVLFSGFAPAEKVGRLFAGTSGIALQPYRGGAALNRGSLAACLAHGLAVVTTRPRQPLEGLAHGKQVWFVDDHPQAIRAGLARVLDDPLLASRLRSGARTAARRFAWPRIASRTLRLYRGVLREPAAGARRPSIF